MAIQLFVCNPFAENTYLFYDDSGAAVLIDPGFYNDEEAEMARDVVLQNGLSVKAIWNTHLHLDHCIGNGLAKRLFNVPCYAGKEDLFLLQNANKQALSFGLSLREKLPEPDFFFTHRGILKIGNSEFISIAVPGHSPGSFAFYNAKESFLFGGDVLFESSRGRTDLPGGDEATLLHSIKTNLLSLPKKTLVFCGHGEITSIENEMAYY